MKKLLLVLILALSFVTASTFTQDPPTGYTVYHGLRMWDEGNYPTADSINQNLIDIDSYLHTVNLRVDTLLNSFKRMHDYPYGSFNDTTYVFGTQFLVGGGMPFYFGTYQASSPLNFMTTGITRMTIDGSGKVTAPGDFEIGDVTVSNSIIVDGTYSSTMTWRQDSDENWLLYQGNTGSEIIFGNTDDNSWRTIDAGAYKTQGTTGYLSSAFGSLTASGLYLANAPSGATTTQLKYTNITINGTTYKVLTAEP